MLVTANQGIPELRHDWAFISDRSDFVSSALATLAWQPEGVGSPRPYPTDYLLAMLDALIVAALGAATLFPLFLFGAAAICVYGSRLLARSLRAPAIARFGLSIFALFNPWVYTEFVAGHIGMIIAYGATMAFCGEVLRPRPRSTHLALFVCIAAAQLQLFLVLIAVALCLAVARGPRLPFASGLVVALPCMIGVLGNRSALLATPYSITWQAIQSVRPVEAAALTGYFANYTAGFTPLAFDAVWSVAALAAIGVVVARSRPVGATFLLLGLAAWLWSTGVNGPVGAFYSFAILHVPALEIFRELYDLLGYVVVAYVALASIATARYAVLARLTLVPGLVLAITWCIASPLRWLVPAHEVPRAFVSAPPHSRVAFIPDVQPLSFEGRGSGLDPDAFPRPHDVMTLNGPGAAYPGNVALRRFALTGDASDLEALGVRRAIFRPWFSTDVRNASPQYALSADLHDRKQAAVVVLKAQCELSVVPDVRVSALPPRIGSGAVFFGDVATLEGSSVPPTWRTFREPVIFTASRRSLRARDAWVDVRPAFVAQPELGQGVGGVVTTSATATLPIASGKSLLVWVRGRLSDLDGKVIVRSTRGYRWIAVDRSLKGVRCAGECIVVAAGDVPAGLRANDRLKRAVPARFSSAAPWLALTTLEPSPSTTVLRYAVGFDPHWSALTRHGALPHVRIETALNGWLVPEHSHPERILLIEPVAAAQACFELFAAGWTLYLIYSALPVTVKRRFSLSWNRLHAAPR